jgi:hypothetical protein
VSTQVGPGRRWVGRMGQQTLDDCGGDMGDAKVDVVVEVDVDVDVDVQAWKVPVSVYVK